MSELHDPVTVFEADGIRIDDWGPFFAIRDNDRDVVDVPRRTFLSMVDGHLYDRIGR